MDASTKRRGPLQVSCGSCKYRRVKCVRSSGEAAPCDGCLKKGIQCAMDVVEKSIHGRSGKRIDSCKQLFGSLPSSSSSSSTALVLSGPETRLADAEMEETFGFELLDLYSNSSASSPLFPPPVFDSYSLKARFEAAGRKLSSLSKQDQLTCRIVFAAASRLRPSAATSAADPAVVRRLLSSAEKHADAEAVWRKPSANSATNLLLLSSLVGGGEINTVEAKMYLNSLVDHLQHLRKVDPAVLTGSNESATGIVWTTLLYDTFSAIERKEEPLLPKRDYDRLLPRVVPDVPPVSAIRFAVKSDAWSLLNYLLLPLAAYIFAGRRLASYLERVDGDASLMAADAAEVMELWSRLEVVGTSAGDALKLAFEGGLLDDFSVTILRLYVILSYCPAIFAQLAIVLHLESLPLRLFNPNMPYFNLLGSHSRFTQNVCAFLRDIRGNETNYLAVFVGTAFSVSRLPVFVGMWVESSVWDSEYHPGGPADKLESAVFLTEALLSVARAYPSSQLNQAVRLLEAEVASLNLLLGTSPSSSSQFAPPGNSTRHPGTRPSLSRLSSWTHLLDKEERGASVYEGERSAAPNAALPQTSPSFFSSTSSSTSPPSFASAPDYPCQTSANDAAASAVFGARFVSATNLGAFASTSSSDNGGTDFSFLPSCFPPHPSSLFAAYNTLDSLSPPTPPSSGGNSPENTTPSPSSFDNVPASLPSIVPPPFDPSPPTVALSTFGASTSTSTAVREQEQFSPTFIATFLDSLVGQAGPPPPLASAGELRQDVEIYPSFVDARWPEQGGAWPVEQGGESAVDFTSSLPSSLPYF